LGLRRVAQKKGSSFHPLLSQKKGEQKGGLSNFSFRNLRAEASKALEMRKKFRVKEDQQTGY